MAMTDDCERVREACELSKDAALVATERAMEGADSEAARRCERVWQDVLSGLAGKKMDLSGADLSEMAFAFCGSGLKGASFQGAKLDRTSWCMVSVEGADFSKASMRECVTWGLLCDGASFRNADLSGAYLCLAGAPDFTEADLTGATFSLAGDEKIIFTGARMNGCKLTFGPQATGRDRRAVLASLSEEQRSQIVRKPWWQFWA